MKILIYPDASGGNLTMTFPISAPGRSTNFPSCKRPPVSGDDAFVVLAFSLKNRWIYKKKKFITSGLWVLYFL